MTTVVTLLKKKPTTCTYKACIHMVFPAACYGG